MQKNSGIRAMKNWNAIAAVFLILITSGFAHSDLPIEGNWKLVGQRCDSPTGEKLYDIDRIETKMGISLKIFNQHFKEASELCSSSLLTEGSFEIVDASSWTIKMKVTKPFRCEIEGIEFYSTRGVENKFFSYTFEGPRLIENHAECAKGQGRWKWIYIRADSPTS